MDRRLTLPAFGVAPETYDPRYMNDLSRLLNQLVSALRSTGEGRNTNIVLTNLPSNDYNAEPGTIFEINGVLYVSVLYRAFVQGLGTTAQVGTVTVTIV